MKKFLTLTLAFVLVLSAFSLFAVSAEEGDPIYVFDVKGVNGVIGGEDCMIFTTQDAYNDGNPIWAVTILLDVKDDGSLVVKQKAISGQGAVPADAKIGNGVIALVVHSAASNVEEKAQYANVEAKIAAMTADVGMTVALEGIDLENASGSGTATLYPAAPTGTDNTSSETSSETSSASSEDSSETSSAASSKDESSTVSETSSETSSAVSSDVTSPAASSAGTSSTFSASQSLNAASSDTSTSTGGLSGGAIAAIVVAVVVVIAAVVAIVVVKRKK